MNIKSETTSQEISSNLLPIQPAMNLNFQTLPTPIPLINRSKADYVPFPESAFPIVLKDAIEAITENVKLPIEMAAASVLAAASYCAQSHVNVMSPKGTISPTSLFLLSVGKSGERKSASDNAALTPIKVYQKQLKISYDTEMIEYKKRKAIYEADFKQITHMKYIPDNKDPEMNKATQVAKLGPEPRHPLSYQIILMDATTEGITTQFSIGQPSLALFIDEGGIFTSGFSMNKDNKTRTVGVLSKLWDEGIADRTRKESEDSYLLENRRLAAHLLIQPELAEDFLADKIMRSQGILSRYLIAWPKTKIGTRIIEEYELDDKLQSDPRIMRYNNDLLWCLQTAWARSPENEQELLPTVLELTPDAKKLWLAAHNWIEDAQFLGGAYESIQGFASKMLENAMRIAGIFEFVINVNATQVSEIALNSALKIMHYYAYQQLEVLGNSDLDVKTSNALALLKWIQEEFENGEATKINYTTISQFAKPFQVRQSKPLLIEALATLEQFNWLVPAAVNVRKNASKTWIIQR
jgi:hypothetical protein